MKGMMTARTCEWCDAPAFGPAPDGGGEMLCAECIAAMTDDREVEHGGEA